MWLAIRWGIKYEYVIKNFFSTVFLSLFFLFFFSIYILRTDVWFSSNRRRFPNDVPFIPLSSFDEEILSFSHRLYARIS